MATVYAVASAKGGVGKTTTTAAIATILADSGADVVAIDADLGMANLAAAVGVAPDGITLHDVLAGAADPLDAVHEGPAGLRVVPGAADLEAYAAADPSRLREVVDAFDDADHVFVDAGAGLSHDSTLPLGLADETLLVSTAERSALGDTEKTRQLTERLGGSVAGAAITRLDPATAADDDQIDAVAETIGVPVIGRIPEDDAVLRAAESAQALPVFAPDAPATRAYRDLTRALTGASIDGPGLAVGSDDEPDDEAADDDSEDRGEDELEPEADIEGADETEAGDEEDIIVADSERAGLGDPGGEEDIIVAAESPAADIDDAEPDASDEDSSAGDDADLDDSDDADLETDRGIDGETERVGEDHVEGDDLEAMIEADLGPEQFDDESDATAASTAEPAAGDKPTSDTSTSDEPADDATTIDESVDDESTDTESAVEPSPGDAPESDGEQESVPDGEPEPASESEPEPSEDADPEPEDELAGSVPFRDDDTGTMNTALSEEEDDDDDDDEKSGGFFSRLLGR